MHDTTRPRDLDVVFVSPYVKGIVESPRKSISRQCLQWNIQEAEGKGNMPTLLRTILCVRHHRHHYLRHTDSACTEQPQAEAITGDILPQLKLVGFLLQRLCSPPEGGIGTISTGVDSAVPQPTVLRFKMFLAAFRSLSKRSPQVGH